MKLLITIRKLEGVRRGVAAFELAVVSPMLLLFALVCVDYGRIIYTRLALSNAVNTGMAYATTHAYTEDTKFLWSQKIEERIVEGMSMLSDFDMDALATTINSVEESDGYYRVELEVEYSFKTLTDWPGVPSTTTLLYHLEKQRIR